MFHIRYQIMTAQNTIVEEGQLYRLEKRVKTSYYHIFRHNYREDRFRGWHQPQARICFRWLLDRFIDKFLNETLHSDEFWEEQDQQQIQIVESLGMNKFLKFSKHLQFLMNEFINLTNSTSECQRDWVEDIYDDYLKQYFDLLSESVTSSLKEEEDDIIAAEIDKENLSDAYEALFLACTSMMGKFGVTSKEKEYVSTAYGAYSYNYNYNYGSTMRFKTPPRPTQMWCRWIYNDMNIKEWYSVRWGDILGKKY